MALRTVRVAAVYNQSYTAKAANRSSPIGAHVVDGGVNFSAYSRDATGMQLLFFDRGNDAKPARVVQISHAGRQYPIVFPR